MAGTKRNPDRKKLDGAEGERQNILPASGRLRHESLTRTLEWDNKSQGRSADYLRLVQRAKDNG
jgi:hypothetical protein